MSVIEADEEAVLTLVRSIFPDATFEGDVDGFLVIKPGPMYTGKNGENLIGNMNLGDEGECFRCQQPVTSRWELVVLDAAERNDCPESEDGLPHEVGEPE